MMSSLIIMEESLRNEAILASDPVSNDWASELISVYEDKSWCCCKCAYFESAKMLLCGHWICSPFKPIIIWIIFTAITGVDGYDIYTHCNENIIRYTLIAVLGFIYLMSVMSYILIIVCGPGYLPYNFTFSKGVNYTWEEEMKSFVIYREQMEYARQRSERAPRSSFSVSARRFVLRADHYCLWTESWIGLKNHRYFMTMTLWVTLYCLYWIGTHYFWLLKWLSKDLVLWNKIVALACGVSLVPVLFLAILHFFNAFINLIHNVTAIEKWKGLKTTSYDDGCFNNFYEVCGSKYCVLLWIFPCFCFKPGEDGLYSTSNYERI